jgi:hypothetical protein
MTRSSHVQSQSASSEVGGPRSGIGTSMRAWPLHGISLRPKHPQAAVKSSPLLKPVGIDGAYARYHVYR